MHLSKEHLGVWLKDRWRYERALRSDSRAYLALANRHEQLEAAPDGLGQACLWPYTSRLHAPSVQPRLAQRLLRRCLADAPISQCSSPSPPFEPAAQPDLSVLIGHRGLERLPLLLATLKSLAAQEHSRIVCLVIEQDSTVHIAPHLPSWVRHIHAPLPDSEAPYNRSHTFNVGAKQARGGTLLLHDNDMLVPRSYCRQILERVKRGYEVINPKRFIFYLNSDHTNNLLGSTVKLSDADYLQQPAEAIVQNLEAGGSLAITASAYDAIGGMDESFVGWGGEDNEFWDRCLTRPTWIWGYEPIIHLWHRSQPLKGQPENPNLTRMRQVLQRPALERIATLRRHSVAPPQT
jgi:hypothetical protein